MFDLALLGPPRLTVDGVEVALPTRKALALVALLGFDGPAPRARLASTLWPDIELEKARGNLRRELNRLKHTALGDQLMSEAGALRLRAPFSCDATTFSKFVQDGNFSDALALYRGPFLDGLELYEAEGFEDWLARRRRSLEERYRWALARRARELEDSGDLRGALQGYLDLLRLDETQETYHREAMRLHHLVGEREAALERFARMKRVLRRELALEPLPETIELARQIRAAKRIDPPPRHESPTHTWEASWVGREAELALLLQTTKPFTLVRGEPGVGKTKLVEEAARRVGECLVVRGSEISVQTPLYPFASALQIALERSESRRRISALPPSARREASRLVPEIEPEAVVESLRQESRARFLDGLALTVAAAAGGSVVLDDLHWFDAQSVELVHHLARRAEKLGVRVFATARPVELEASEALRACRELQHDDLMLSVELGAFGLEEVQRLLQRFGLGHRDRELAERLLAATGGNALFVVETLKGLDPDEDRAELPIPPGVRESVRSRVDKLGPAVQRLVEAASLAGARFSLEDVAPATGLAAFDALDAVERALSAGVFERRDDALGFHHDLVRRTIAEALSAERKKLIHGRLADSLASHRDRAAEVAEHFLLADRPQQSAAFQARAAEDAFKLSAHQEALERWARALALGLAPDEQALVHRRRIAVFRLLDDRSAWQAEVDRLDEMAAGPLALLSRAELENARGKYLEALELSERVIESQASSTVVDRGRLEAGRALLNLGRTAEARARFERALELAPESDLGFASEVHESLFACALQDNDLTRAEAENERARRVDQEREDRYGLVLALMNDGTIRRRAGDQRTALVHLAKARDEAHEAGFVSLERSALLALSSVHNMLGEYERATELAQQGIDLAREPQDPLMEARLSNALAVFEYARGRLGRSLASSKRAVELADSIQAASWSAIFRCGLTHTLIEIGDYDEARATIEPARLAVEELGLAGQKVVVESHVAFAELMQGQPENARDRIRSALESGAPPSMDADLTLAVLSLAELECGAPKDALHTLEGQSLRPIHRARMLAIRLRALVELGQPVDAELAESAVLFEDARLSPVEALDLRRQRTRVLEKLGRHSEAERERAIATQLANELATSLEDRPEIARRLRALDRP